MYHAIYAFQSHGGLVVSLQLYVNMLNLFRISSVNSNEKSVTKSGDDLLPTVPSDNKWMSAKSMKSFVMYRHLSALQLPHWTDE